jgi:hypothetical protein
MRRAQSGQLINRPGKVITLEGSIASDTANKGGGVHGARKQKENARTGQLVETHIAQGVNTVAGLVIQASMFEQVTEYHKNAQHGIINVTCDRASEPWHGAIVSMSMCCTRKKEARQDNSKHRSINHSNSKMIRGQIRRMKMPTYMSKG